MSLTQSIDLQNVFHRRPVTPSDVVKRLAAAHPMMHDLRLWWTRGLLHLGNGDERRRGSTDGQLHPIAGRHDAACRSKRGIPTQKFLPAKAGRPYQRRQRCLVIKLNFSDLDGSIELQSREILLQVHADLDRGEKLGIKVFGREAPVGMI